MLLEVSPCGCDSVLDVSLLLIMLLLIGDGVGRSSKIITSVVVK